MNKPIYRYSLKTIAIITGIVVVLLSASLYAANQFRQGYKSVIWTSNVYLHTGTVSFNSNQIEEHGDCKIVTQNTCSKDVFIPTKTSPEWTAFKNNHPACIQLADCSPSCILKEFVEGVYDGTIQYSKMRNALSGFINDQTTRWGFWSNTSTFVPGYGEKMEIALKTVYDGRPKIVSKNSIVATGINEYTGSNIYEFELYGITPETENTNRWCFTDGSYWVNSNVYSRQTLQYINSIPRHWYLGDFTTSRFWGVVWVNFWLRLGTDGKSKYNRFFGCKSDLLPNPDKYCVERVVPKAGTSADKPTAIYLKEFTNNASFGYAGCHGSGNTCILQRNTICSALTGIANTTFTTFTSGSIDSILPMITSNWSYNNTGFIYRNTSGANYWSQIFWFYHYIESTFFPFVTTLDGASISDILDRYWDNNYYYYYSHELLPSSASSIHAWHTSRIGYNSTLIENTGYIYGIRIPLSGDNSFTMWKDFTHDGFMDPIENRFTSPDNDLTSIFWMSGLIIKYVCVAHTCGPCYTPTANWCTLNPFCEELTPGWWTITPGGGVGGGG